MENSKPQSAGGKSTAIILRKKAIEKYYSSPNLCKKCSKIIEVKENEKVSSTKRKKFCNRSCSSSFNNQGILRVKKLPENNKNKVKKSSGINISDLTKEEIFKRYNSYQGGRSMICKNAKKVYDESGRDKKCFECGYERKIDIAHIKSVSSFSLDSKISEINDIRNLLALCPNHHSEFDDGYLKIDIDKINFTKI
jgi:hypothetical protein